MGLLATLFGSRRRREARREAEQRVRATLASSGVAAAWGELTAALAADPEAVGLLHVAAHLMRVDGDFGLAELFDRAGDAPHDPQRSFELGSALLSREEAELAAATLERALALVPFDAVVRSELALAHARAGRPAKVVETLALHPCLADDPGALFEFGWASLLSGDLDAAEGALRELSGAPDLKRKLSLALDRARLSPGDASPRARDFYFVEHGGLLLDARGPSSGRYEHLDASASWTAEVLAELGGVLRTLLPRPRHVIQLDPVHGPLARAVARACEGTVLRAGQGRLPAGLLPLLRGHSVETDLDRESREAEGLCIFALTVDPWRSLARAPEFVGAFARKVDRADPADLDVDVAGGRAPAEDLARFVEARRALLPPAGPRVLSAYVPDAPLPR